MAYQSTKTFGHELGLSACFRQWRAKSHCNMLHGYALSFKFVFEAETLDDRNWVMDFGGLKVLKLALCDLFDHKLIVASDDPQFAYFLKLGQVLVADVTVLESVGCEAFAKIAFDLAHSLIVGEQITTGQRVRVVSCECAEHGANSAIYIGDK